jgi:hypothetical protein
LQRHHGRAHCSCISASAQPFDHSVQLCIFANLQVPHWAARRQDLLRREYLTAADVPAQPHHGFKGQVAACWRHSLSNKEAHAIAAGALRFAMQLVLPE